MKNEALANEIRAIRTEINQKIHAGLDGEQFAGIKSCLVSIEAALRANAAPQGGQKGDGETCYYCGKNISIFSSNPDEGCPVPLMHRDEPGKMKWHHIGCVMDRLIENQPPSPAAGHAEGGQLDRVIQECEEYQNAYRAFRALSVWGKTDYKPLDDADKELALSVYRRAQRGDKNTLHNDLTRLLCAAEGDDLIQVVRTIIEQRDKAILESSTSPDSVVVPSGRFPVDRKESPITGPTYYVRHPDDSYSVDDPQPQLISSPQQTAPEQQELIARLLDSGHDLGCGMINKRNYAFVRVCNCTLLARKQAAEALSRSHEDGRRETWNEARVRAELGGTISDDGGLYNIGHYIAWDVGDKDVTLDCRFSPDELEAIAWWMRHKTPKGGA